MNNFLRQHFSGKKALNCFILGLVFSCWPHSAARADGSIPVEILKEIKGATVFVKVSRGVAQVQGSGFLMKVDGTTGYVVTNHHVVSQAVPIRPGVSPSITAVFHSGTRAEQVVTAQLIASDPESDLAVLKVTDVKNLPHPIDLDRKVEPVETMSVYIFGFPFGQHLSMTKGNPAMTVGRGFVSSIRENDQGEVAYVQIDGPLNPGNSGGPVVDSKGHLVGIAVASIRGSEIGLTIPPEVLAKMLLGRVGGTALSTRAADAEKADVEAEVLLIDPMNQLRSVNFHYLVVAKAGSQQAPGSPGKWEELPGSNKIGLKVEGQKASGTFPVTSGGKSEVQVSFQVSYLNGEGKKIYSAPATYRVQFAKPLTTVKIPDSKASD